MHRLHDIPIRWKLRFFTAVAIALLATLVVISLHKMAVIDEVERQTGAAVTVELRLQAAMAAVRELRVAAHEIRLQPGAAAVAASSALATRNVDAARLVLAEIGERSVQDRPLVAQVRLALDAFAATVAHAAELRAALIMTRDRDFLEFLPRLESAISALQSQFKQAGDGLADGNALRGELDRYGGALTTVADQAVRFLVTSDEASRNKAQAAAAMSTTYARRLSQAPLPSDLRQTVTDMLALGQQVSGATDRMFRMEAELTAYADREARAAEGALSETLAKLRQAAADRVRAAQAASGKARRTARVAVEWLSGALIVMLVLSGALVRRLIATPVCALTESVQRIAGSDTNFAVPYRGRSDEIGRMAAALEHLREVAATAFAQNQVIEQSPNGVMLVDATGQRITFMNARLKTLFGALGLQVPEGTAVHEVIRDAGLAAALSCAETLPYAGELAANDETVAFRADALVDQAGRYAGAVLVWQRSTERGQLVSQFEQSVGAVAEAVRGAALAMSTTASAMDGTAGETDALASAVAAASAQAADHVKSVAVTAEQLAHSVEEIARQVSAGAEMAARAVDETRATDRCVLELNEAAIRVGDVVRLIAGVAAQTNLLALNATIEAARAGEAGRGFAVVANEVKTLAGQTARATDDIAAHVAGMQNKTRQAVGALRTIAETVQRLSGVSATIAVSVDRQGEATRAIANAVQQAATGTRDVSAHIGGVTGAVARTRTQSGEVLHAADALGAQSDHLRSQVDRFLDSVRQAA